MQIYGGMGCKSFPLSPLDIFRLHTLSTSLNPHLYSSNTNSFHCLFCHGFEERGATSAGVLALGPLLGGSGSDAAPLVAPNISRMASRLAGSVTVYTDGNEELGSRIRAQLKSTTKFHVENRRVVRLGKDPDVEGEAGVLVTLEDGTVNREGFLVSSSSPRDTPQRLFFSSRELNSNTN